MPGRVEGRMTGGATEGDGAAPEAGTGGGGDTVVGAGAGPDGGGTTVEARGGAEAVLAGLVAFFALDFVAEFAAPARSATAREAGVTARAAEPVRAVRFIGFVSRGRAGALPF